MSRSYFRAAVVAARRAAKIGLLRPEEAAHIALRLRGFSGDTFRPRYCAAAVAGVLDPAISVAPSNGVGSVPEWAVPNLPE